MPELSEEELEQKIEERVQEKTKALEEKRDELLDENKSLKEDKRQLESQFQDLKEDFQDMKQQQAEEEEDIEAVKENMREQYEEQIDELESQLNEQEQFIEEQVVDNQLTEQLLDAGIAKPFLPAAKSMLKEDVKVTKEDGTFQAVAENGEGRKPLSDHVESFVESEQGQHYLAADDNTGGGANGGSNGGGQPSEDNPWTSGNLTEIGRLKQEDPEKAQRLKQEAEQQGEIDDSVEGISVSG